MIWISKREALALVIAAESPDALGSRACACSLLGQWMRAGKVRTRPGERPPWAKHPRRLYLRADIELLIRRRGESNRHWRSDEDALLGTDSDVAIAARLGLAAHQVYQRRRKLDIDVYRSPRSERRIR